MHSRTVSSIFPFSEKEARLTAEEWMLILKALSELLPVSWTAS